MALYAAGALQSKMTTTSTTTGAAARSCSYVKDNDIKLGLSVASRKVNTGVVNGLRCRFCLAFGREERIGAKRKAATLGQSWTAPFRYDNIETHVRNQHASKWAEYEQAKKTWDFLTPSSARMEQCDLFFVKKNDDGKSPSIKAHFHGVVSPSLPSSIATAHEKPMVLVIDKDIIDVIIGDMYYSSPLHVLQPDQRIEGEDGTTADGNITACFGSAAEHAAVQANRLETATQMKIRALSVFKKQKVIVIENNGQQLDGNHEVEQHDDTLLQGGEEGADAIDASSDYQYIVTIPSSKKTLMTLALRYISCGVTFRMAHNILQHTAEVFGLRSMACSRGDISMMARVACASNLQRISDLLKKSWAFSIAIDSATHQSTSYLDLRFRIYSKSSKDIHNLHGCALPLHDRHTGEVMHDMISKFLSVLCPHWRIALLGVASDGARNMTGRASGVVTRLQRSMHEKCRMIRIWCGAHQFDLVMEHIMTKVVHESFFSVMLRFITHLSRQQKLIADMGTTCPRIVNRWLSSYKVTNWFKLHRPALLNYIRLNNPTTAPSRIWWVYLVAMDAFTNYTAVTFRYIQGATTLASQQDAAFKRLIATFIDDVSVQGPLSPEDIELLDPGAYVSSGLYAVLKICIREYLVGLASWVEQILEETEVSVQEQLLSDIGRVFTVACDRISNVCVLRNEDNGPYIDAELLPPVLPNALVKIRPGDFLRKVCAFKFRLQHQYSDAQVDVIADEHRALIMHYRNDEVMKQGIDSLQSTSSFIEAWGVVGKDGFQNLAEFCGVIATLFPGTSTVESDFSVLRWEKDDFRKNLSDFGLEAVLQAKQHLMIQQIL
jgi:hypothetical protein